MIVVYFYICKIIVVCLVVLGVKEKKRCKWKKKYLVVSGKEIRFLWFVGYRKGRREEGVSGGFGGR